MTHHEIDITAASDVLALEQLLLETVRGGSPGPDRQASFLLGYNVEATNLTALVRKAIEEIQVLTAEQSARVVACEVSGLHATDEGQRLWGTIECVAAPMQTGTSTRVDSVTLEQASQGMWRLTAFTTSKE